MFFHASTFASAWFGGFWPGLCAALGGAVLGNILFLGPTGALSVSREALAATTLFMAIGALVSTLFESRSRALRRTEEAVRAREDFLSVAGHELRTPLTALRLRLQQIQRVERTTDRENVAAALRQVGRISSLVDELLDLARLGDSERTIEPTRIELGRLVRNVAERFSDQATRTSTPIVIRAPQPVEGEWDEEQLEHAVTNLLLNALKYGRGHPVEVRVEADGALALFSVRDHGIGISQEDQLRIFERFERAVSSRSYGGLGLGLWISREIVRAHGGEIRVQSQPGGGATFTIELPVASPPTAP
jgi:signal transduction histidine kinase